VASILASPNPATTQESTVSLQTNSNGNTTNWYLNDSLISTFNQFAYTFPKEPGQYQVQLVVTNQLGCSDTGFVTVVIREDIIFYVPNSFTPNDDDFNNVFTPVITSGIDFDSYSFAIYNRWGERIFETTTVGAGWDGTYKGMKSPDGIYTWNLQFKSNFNDGVFIHHGHTALIR
jgi:gliding motility-associated-like protein